MGADRTEIRPPAWKLALAALGIVAFVALGIAILLYGDGLLQRAVGVLGVVFFGGFCGYALVLGLRGEGRLAIRREGLEINIPGVKPRLVPWRDIESISAARLANAEFTTVRLNSYEALLDGLSADEAKKLLARFRALRRIGQASIVVGAANFENVGNVVTALAGSAEVKSVQDLLLYLRQNFGAEFHFGWNMRDRNAQDFAAYLEAHRLRGCGDTAQP